MRKTLILLAAVSILIPAFHGSTAAFSLNFDLGSIGTVAKKTAEASRPITDEEEYYIGRAVAARILSDYRIYENKKMTEYVNLIGVSVALHSDKPFTYGGYHFVILDSNEMNAFACPGGIIFVTRGMVNATRNEDELAAVLAHEIAHVNHQDGISAIKSSRWTEALTVMGTTAAKSYTKAELANLVSIFEGSIDDIFKTLVVNGYSKSQEHSADETALIYLARTGYSPLALKVLIEGFMKTAAASEGGITKTHPATEDRVDNVNGKMPSSPPPVPPAEIRFARYRTVIPR